MKHKGKKILSLLLAVLMLVGLAIPSGILAPIAWAADGDEEPAEPTVEPVVPEHQKTVKPNGDGTYQIELTVTGDADAETSLQGAVNVVVVVDTSNSMINNTTTYNGSSVRRADAAEKIVYDFTHNLFAYAKQGADIQMALVTFNASATDQLANGDTPGWTTATTPTNYQTQESRITSLLSSTGANNSAKLTYNAGTNWEGALQQTLTLLGSADKHDTYVVFVTDGAPSKVIRDGAVYPAGTGFNAFLDAEDAYGPAQDEALQIENYNTALAANAQTYEADTSNTTFYGIYAFGSEADYLDDVVYYARNGVKRSSETSATVATPGYYSATNADALNAAIAEIFSQIADFLGIADAVITDGTTSSVKTTSGSFANLLDVDQTSFKYWLSFQLTKDAETGAYSFQRMNSGGQVITYSVTEKSDGTIDITWTDSEGDKKVNVNGTIDSYGVLKYQWTAEDDLYNVTPPTATYEDAAVKWDLDQDTVGTLLTGVTYSVTFDVWPSQETLDYIADIKNDPSVYDKLDANIKQYLKEDGSLITNTGASLTYKDTRADNPGPYEETFIEPDPVSTAAVETMVVSKVWENELDGRTASEITLKVLRDGVEKYPVPLKESEGWENEVAISVGIMSVDANKNVTVRAPGHDFAFAEPEDMTYHWELKAPTMHPMWINGETKKEQVEVEPEEGEGTGEDDEPQYMEVEVPVITMLVLVEDEEEIAAIPSTVTETQTDGTYYKLPVTVTETQTVEVDGEEQEQTVTKTVYQYYKIDSSTNGALTATNSRRSSIVLVKEVTGTNVPADAKFPFTLTVVNSLAPDEEPTNDPGYDTDWWVWVSVWDETGTPVNSGVVTDGAELSAYDGWYIGVSGEPIKMNIGAGYSIRINNVPTGTTYTIAEGELSDDYSFVSSEVALYTTQAVMGDDGEPTNDTEDVLMDETVSEDAFTAGQTTTGEIEVTNRIYKITFTNKYELASIQVVKEFSGITEDQINPDFQVNVTYDGQETPIALKLTDEEGLEVSEDGLTYTWTVGGLPNKKLVTAEEANESINGYSLTANAATSGTATTDSTEIKTINLSNPFERDTGTLKITKALGTDSAQVTIPDGTTFTISGPADYTGPASVTYKDFTNGSYTIENVPTGDYTITETVSTAAITGYTLTDPTYSPTGGKVTVPTGDTGEVTVTNTYELDKATLKIVKNFSGATPPDTAEFVISGTPLAADQKFTDVKVTYADIKDGKYELTVPAGSYTVTETEDTAQVEGYTLTVSGANATAQDLAKNGEVTFTITNTYAKDTATLKITKETTGATTPDDAKFVISGTPTAEDLTFEDVTVTYDKIKNGDYELVVPAGSYTVTETESSAQVDGYTLTVGGDNATAKDLVKDSEVTFKITNEYTADKAKLKITKETTGATTPDTAEFVISGTPLAADQKFADVKVTYADIKNGTYELEVPAGSYTVTETESSAQVDGYTLVVSGDNGTAKDLEKDGTVTFAISNTYAKDTATLKITKTTTGATTPDSAKFVISGKPTAADLTFADVTVTYADIKDGKYELTVPAGSYTVTEDPDTAKIAGYTLTISGDNATAKDLAKDGTVTFALTNTYAADEATLKITKTTTGATTPDTAKFVISGKPTAADVTFADVTITYADIKDGKYELTVPAGSYTVTEDQDTAKVDGYALTVSGDNGTAKDLEKDGTVTFAISNTYAKDTATLKITKTTTGATTPDSAAFVVSGTPTAADLTFADVTVTYADIKDGKYELTVPAGSYTVTETESTAQVEGYDLTVGGDNASAKDLAKDSTVTFALTNTYTVNTIDISGKKTWDDNDNKDGNRPASITVNLLANGENVGSKTVTEADGWAYTFTGLAKVKDGAEIQYTISEEPIEYYTASIDGYNITNKYTPDVQNIEVSKIWDDNDNQDGVRPASITVYLLVNGEKCGESKTLSESNGWADSWTGLPKKQAGKDLTYTVEEDTASLGDLYDAQDPVKTASGYTITNKHVPEVLDPVKVTKVWNDDNNKTGKRPSSVTVTLLADGKSVATATLTEANGWTYTFEDLPKYEKGKEIKYTLKEATVSGYTSAVTGNTTDGFTVTNTVKDDTPPSPPPVIRIEIVKVWEDDSNASGTRTETVEVTLLKGGVKNLTRNLGDSNEWKYEGYVEAGYDYKVVETPVEGYESIVTQSPIPGGIRFTVVNKLTKTPELNTKDHVAYIVGYPDGTVRPGKEITRAEVATIFFRLLTEEARDKYWSQTNPYPDVKLDDWFNNAISTLTNMGIINGYEDGTFRPNNPITRAELTKMAVSFFSSADQYFGKTPSFSDVPADAWYTRFIAAAEALGLINGYPDGTFRPTNYITRAETCTIVNRTLGRGPHKDHLLPYAEMINWPDNTPDAWYYAQIQEASNSHDYDWITEQIENTTVEQWLAKLPERDWVALEQIWSNSHSAPGGEVMG